MLSKFKPKFKFSYSTEKSNIIPATTADATFLRNTCFVLVEKALKPAFAGLDIYSNSYAILGAHASHAISVAIELTSKKGTLTVHVPLDPYLDPDYVALLLEIKELDFTKHKLNLELSKFAKIKEVLKALDKSFIDIIRNQVFAAVDAFNKEQNNV